MTILHVIALLGSFLTVGLISWSAGYQAALDERKRRDEWNLRRARWEAQR